MNLSDTTDPSPALTPARLVTARKQWRLVGVHFELLAVLKFLFSGMESGDARAACWEVF